MTARVNENRQVYICMGIGLHRMRAAGAGLRQRRYAKRPCQCIMPSHMTAQARLRMRSCWHIRGSFVPMSAAPCLHHTWRCQCACGRDYIHIYRRTFKHAMSACSRALRCKRRRILHAAHMPILSRLSCPSCPIPPRALTCAHIIAAPSAISICASVYVLITAK